MKQFRVFFMLIILFCIGCTKQKSFNQTDWKNWTETEATIDSRWLMHKDLLNKYQLKGISKDSIINLLGEPNSINNNSYFYQLGATGRGINNGTMIIVFKEGSVVKVDINEG